MIYCHLSWAVIRSFATAGKPVNVQDTIAAFTHRLRLIIQRSQRKEMNFCMARGGAAVFQSLGMGNTILSGLCRCADMQKKQSDSDSRWHLLSQTPMTLGRISQSIVCSFHSQTRWGVLMKSGGTAVWGEGPVSPLAITAPRRGTAAPHPVYSHMTNHRPKTGEHSHTSIHATSVSPFKMCYKHQSYKKLLLSRSLNHQNSIQKEKILQDTSSLIINTAKKIGFKVCNKYFVLFLS